MEKIPPFHYDSRIQTELCIKQYSLDNIRTYLSTKNVMTYGSSPKEIVNKMIQHLIAIGYMDTD
jgi:hypothetical protein